MVTDDAELTSVHGVEALRWPNLAELGVDAVVTARSGGVSTGPYDSLNLGLHVDDDADQVVENRRRAARLISADLSQLVFATQVHGSRVMAVTNRDMGKGSTDVNDSLGDADALVTNVAGPVLVILVADCVPILLVDPRERVMGVVHAGWRGTAVNVVAGALGAMTTLGARADRVHAYVGPAVASSRYQVGNEVATALRHVSGVNDHAGRWPGVIEPDGPEHWLVDLPRANAHLLEAAGVSAEQIHLTKYVTGASGPFFSDREARPCGRFGLLARLAP